MQTCHSFKLEVGTVDFFVSLVDTYVNIVDGYTITAVNISPKSSIYSSNWQNYSGHDSASEENCSGCQFSRELAYIY